MKNEHRSRFTAAYLLLFCAVFALVCLRIPYLNWDMIGYVASADAYKLDDAAALQKEVYGLLKQSVPGDRYSVLTTGHDREVRATDPQSLHQHLPFYQIRVVYVGLIAALWKLGLNPFFATYLISAVCSAVALYILVFLLPVRGHPLLVLLVPFMAVFMGFYDIARFSTPDALAVLAVYISYFLLLRRHKALLLALPACLLIRTDLVLLVPLFHLYLWYVKMFDRRMVLASALLSIALYMAVNLYFHNYGWSTIFDYTLAHKSTHPADYPHAVTIGSYLTALRSGLESLVTEFAFLIYSAAVLVCGVLLLPRLRHTRRATGFRGPALPFVVFSSFAYVVLHFLLFPIPRMRFFAGQYALTMTLAAFLLLETASFYIRLRPTVLASGALSESD